MLAFEEDLNTSDNLDKDVVLDNFRNVVACTLDKTRVLARFRVKDTLLTGWEISFVGFQINITVWKLV